MACRHGGYRLSHSRLADFSTLPFFPFSSSRVYPVRRGFVIILAIQLIPVRTCPHEMMRRKQPGAMQFELECLCWCKRDRESNRRDYETRYVERERTWVWIRSLTSRKDEENVSVLRVGRGTMRRGR